MSDIALYTEHELNELREDVLFVLCISTSCLYYNIDNIIPVSLFDHVLSNAESYGSICALQLL